ncbi:uncharacterized protein BDZ99DRAFT_414029 [Mytilinidion resinicola]|uniref:CorA-like transporter domain-containing protein n=1 Tax=Mytilinidion resinicola TaxID=574789 RepID=A0A6A6YU53_9PEZI|nr:uncharacterized protein BDZ99DRAFT_414029 [Mytilinidion resinicola]KAF2811554.1 hypothetical protein BDZ99DRAFT_414029 [Mytilinidion resinicola]
MAIVRQLPVSFQTSFSNSTSYPENLIHRGTSTYPTALKAYRKRLDDVSPKLLLHSETHAEVPIIDLCSELGNKIQGRYVNTTAKLTSVLGIESRPNPAAATQNDIVATKRDPKCRFIYFYGPHSRARLRATRDILSQILTCHQVMPAYLDFMFVFGSQSEPRDLRFSGFREQTALWDPPRGQAVTDLGRSGRQYQLCYNLKCVTLKAKNEEDPSLTEWSIRQAAIHHQFDVVYGTTLWIVTTGHSDLENRFRELTGKDGRPEDKSFDTLEECFRSSLSAHLLYCHWSTEEWRWYIGWIEEVMDEKTFGAVFSPTHRQYKPHHIQDLQQWEDKTNEVIMVLEANVEVMRSLRDFYTAIFKKRDFPNALKDECMDDLHGFAAQIDSMIYDLRMQIARAVLFVKITNDRKELVKTHLQTQATERMERLNRNMEREAIVMRIITFVTLIYLPATFVSTFFSTDIIKYQSQTGDAPGEGTFSKAAMNRWIQVTLPLTVLTLLFAWSFLKLSERWRTNQESPRAIPKQQPAKATSGSPTGGLLPTYLRYKKAQLGVSIREKTFWKV